MVGPEKPAWLPALEAGSVRSPNILTMIWARCTSLTAAVQDLASRLISASSSVVKVRNMIVLACGPPYFLEGCVTPIWRENHQGRPHS